MSDLPAAGHEPLRPMGSDLPLRLRPGADLRRSLEEAARVSAGGSAFVVGGIGSLVNASLRLADAQSETLLQGPFEILTLSGTLSPDGAHLHMAVADPKGQVLGGHVGYGNEIRTTAELLLLRLPGWTLARQADEVTGFRELVIRPAPEPERGETD